ncbi:MAG: GTP cyclohydrolase I FolE [Dehalococcoidia bacterium]|nr:GTP cyclohydrolase I FolE [Dehalococcoidia bacterium]MDW8120407.1 GTP cyclohydrolase I FolE [Chloroflexota bacterium]
MLVCGAPRAGAARGGRVFQEERIRRAVREILEAVGEDPQREGLQETPQRVAEMLRELLRGLQEDPQAFLALGLPPEGAHGLVLVRDIPFYSLCEHHLLPFFGHAHIGYLPRERIVGASKLVRAWEALARRPQLQERLTNQMADALYQALQPRAVFVVVAAEHLCMSMRGVQKPGTRLVTQAWRGDAACIQEQVREFLALLRQGG